MMQFMCFLNSVPSIFKSSQIRLLGISCLSSQGCSYMTMHWKLPQVQIAEVNKQTALLWSPFMMGIQGSDVHHVKNVISKMIIFLQHCEIMLLLYMLATAISFSDKHAYTKHSECKKKKKKHFCKGPINIMICNAFMHV